MQNTAQTLERAIGELRCLRPGELAGIDELHALRAARDSIDELIQVCVDELRLHPHAAHTWASIALKRPELVGGS